MTKTIMAIALIIFSGAVIAAALDEGEILFWRMAVSGIIAAGLGSAIFALMSKLFPPKMGIVVRVPDNELGISVSSVQAEAWGHAEEAGFHDLPEKGFFRSMALTMTEIAEAVEAYHKGTQYDMSEHQGLELTQLSEELADIVIRVADEAQTQGVDLETAIVKKMAYNVTRPRLHGKKN